VTCIEQMPLGRVEYVGARPVINFEGQLLPVDDAGGVLTAFEGNSEVQIVVVVCRERNRHVGIAVSHVLDVATGAELFEAGTTLRPQGVTLLKERVTGVVNLGGIADLVTEEADANQWSPAAEAVQ
jgi:two-component system chemotaxis sensor kinase CheA